ncbi:hypothetical protein [Andreprevotia chitinilytica]|uniref:hypothetical protein n=1 Tax=Andreprevotia chitinilytica TaxID=396808 RepID=UPI000552862C|nr:hypothetical protein [Andreprevotia chitinilytica]
MTKPDNDDSVSPLFNKMDALMARHRGTPPAGQVIPVLTDEADDHLDLAPLPHHAPVPEEAIPVLTETVEPGALMFDPNDFFKPPPPAPAYYEPPRPVPVAPAKAEFLDLPLLDLDALAVQPTSSPLDDWSLFDDSAAEAEHHPAVASPAAVAAPIEYSALSTDEAVTTQASDELELEVEADVATPAAPELLALAAEPVTPEPIAEPPVEVELQLEAAPVAEALSANEEPDEELTITFEDEPLERGEAIREETPRRANLIEASPAPVPVDEIGNESTLDISFASDEGWDLRLDAEPDTPEVLAEVLQEPAHSASPVEAPHLDDQAVEALTASVGAHLAVEIASEIEQLTRQHFTALVSTLYGDTLRKLTAEIAQELDARLAPRIEQLVRDELRRQKLLK